MKSIDIKEKLTNMRTARSLSIDLKCLVISVSIKQPQNKANKNQAAPILGISPKRMSFSQLLAHKHFRKNISDISQKFPSSRKQPMQSATKINKQITR